MPAEWAPHRATWLTWPRREGISFPNRFEPVPAIWARMCALLSPGEEVHINYFSEEQEREIRAALEQAGLKIGQRIFLHNFPAYEPWCRDHGPIFVKNGDRIAVVDWDYNAWGGKYPPCDLDDAVPQRVAALLGLPLFEPHMVLEGGSIEVDGAGTLLTTEACLLNPNRNPDLTKAEIEQRLCDYLGVEKILWLGEGIVGDDTDGHVDDIARFVDEQTVLAAVEEDPADDNYRLLQDNRRRLESLSTAKGEPLRVIELPMPKPVSIEGQRVPASYANFYIANEVVLLPVFGQRNDECARAIVQECFPTRRVVALDSRDLIWGLGSFHCVTQQQPA